MGDTQRIGPALSKAYGRAEERQVRAEDARIIVFSDQHRGTRDGADDFKRCEPAYSAALGWYLEEGYTLYVLGDAEELWENDVDPVLSAGTGYAEVLALEAEFHAAGRYERFYGNHDDLWSHAEAVRRHLHPVFPGVEVREGLRLRVVASDGADGVLFFVHGHQGTSDSDRFGWLSRLVVRLVWRPIQRKSGYAGVTPARDFALRARHDRAMSAWAGEHPDKPILITGHTHRPVFWDSTPAPAEVPVSDDGPAGARADEEFAAALLRDERTVYTLPTPCYFNTGCCCFGDGDVTGIEIAEREIRLVRWPQDDGRPRRRILARRALADVLDSVAGRAPQAVVGTEVVPEATNGDHRASAPRPATAPDR